MSFVFRLSIFMVRSFPPRSSRPSTADLPAPPMPMGRARIWVLSRGRPETGMTAAVSGGREQKLASAAIPSRPDGGPGRAEIIGPEDDRQHALEERELGVADGEQPGGEPDAARGGVLFDPDSLR